MLATGTWNGAVTGLNELQSQYEKKYGPGNYVPDVFIQYWSMRVMAYLATLVLLLALWGGWLLHKDRLRSSRLFLSLSIWAVVTPFLMNTAGWLLTESGTPAVDRAGPAEDRQRELAVGQRHRDLDQPDRVRAGLHRARRRPTSS